MGTHMYSYVGSHKYSFMGKDNGLTWVYTNTHTCELIGKDDGLTLVNTNTPTWELIGTVMWVYTNTLTRELNRNRRTGPDPTRQTDRQTDTNLSFYRTSCHLKRQTFV
jgi:hypothetical protein